MENVNEREINFKLLSDLFFTFFKLSPISFGGGFAMIPVLEAEIVYKKKWIDGKQIVDTFVLAQSAPGAIATNSAIFVGYQIAGVPGAIAAMMGMIIPTFVIVIILASLFVFFQTNHYVLAALNGIRPVIVALIASAAYKMSETSLIDRNCWIICLVCVAVLLLCPNINIMVVILSGAFIGIAIMKVKKMFSTSVKTK